MTTYEYTFVSGPTSYDQSLARVKTWQDVWDELNGLGEKGWRVVASFDSHGNTEGFLVMRERA